MKRLLVCGFMLALFGVQAVEAQRKPPRASQRYHREQVSRRVTPVEFGVRGGYDFDEEAGSAGAQLRIPLAREIHLVPSGDVFFADSRTEWQLNADLTFRPDGLGGLYGGVGAAFVNRDFEPGSQDTRVGYNLLVGLSGGWFGGTTVQPFVEARWTDVEEYSPFRFVAGINVPVTGGRR
jgi:hypothetical protein